jgi:hypothetical protein
VRRLLPALTALLILICVPAASAAVYDVTGTADGVDPLGCTAVGFTFQCSTLRTAVAASNTSVGEADSIVLRAGTYTLSQGPLTLEDDVGITGLDTRATTIQATGTQAVTIASDVTASLTNVTVQGGSGSSGGNILVGSGGQLALAFARVTGGSASLGGGIANLGTATIANSLVDGNQASSAGGGIFNTGTLQLVNSTVTGNRIIDGFGAGIHSEGDSVNLLFSTVARNLGTGFSANGAQSLAATGTIIAGNQPNCTLQSAAFSNPQSSLENGTTCGLTNADPLVAAAATNEGGPTNVVAIPANSPAVDVVAQCPILFDQRNYTRTTPCDAGAYEQSGTPPTGGGGEEPTPTPTATPPAPTPTPVPTATPTPTATPVTNRSVAADTSGTVLIKRGGRFVPLADGIVPNGSEIDTKKGSVTITTSTGDKAKFFDGIFKITQTRGLTTLTLSEKLDCAKRRLTAAKKPKSRKLWGDGKGKFRTKGTYSAATVRGTKWLVRDTCTTTTTRVTSGTVQVEDFVKKRKKLVRKGKSYVARKKR